MFIGRLSAPILHLSLRYGSAADEKSEGILEESCKNLQELRRDFMAVQEKLLPTVVTGWKLWPAAHIINFAFVPLRHRILYINLISVCTHVGTHAAQSLVIQLVSVCWQGCSLAHHFPEVR